MNNNKEIDSILNRVLDLDGMIGAMVFTSITEVLGARISDQCQGGQEEEICGVLLGMIESINDLEIFPTDIVYAYSNIQLKHPQT